MSLSNLYFKGCFEQLSDEQRKSLQERCATADVVDRGCGRESINSCGKNISELFEAYELYSTQKGLYKSWGDIEFPWQISELTPDLLFASTDDKWGVSSYRQVIAYPKGSEVLFIEKDGYEVSLYKANSDVFSISGPFNRTKWDKICSVQTTKQTGLPSPKELKERFSFYSLDLFYKNWEEVTSTWSQSTYFDTFEKCKNNGKTLKEIEDCVNNSNSDRWKEARVKKDFFYRVGDFVLVEGECGDIFSVYAAIKDIPTSDFIRLEYSNKGFQKSMYLTQEDKDSDTKTIVWELVYSVPTNINKCLEYQRTKSPEEGYDVVQIGSLGHYAEFPIPYKLRSKGQSEPLDVKSRRRENPTVLSDKDIFNLENPIYPYITECE